MGTLLGVLILFSALAGRSEAQSSGEFLTFTRVFIEDARGNENPRQLVCCGRNGVIQSSPKNSNNIRTQFDLVKEGGVGGVPIYYGDLLYIRTPANRAELWLAERPAGTDVFLQRGDLPDVAVLAKIERVSGRPPNPRDARAGDPNRVMFGRPFVLRLARSDNWLTFAANGTDIETTSLESLATPFTVVDPLLKRTDGAPSPFPPSTPVPPRTAPREGPSPASTEEPAGNCVREEQTGTMDVWLYRNTCQRTVRFTVTLTCHDINVAVSPTLASVGEAGPNAVIQWSRSQRFGSFCANPAITKTYAITKQVFVP